MYHSGKFKASIKFQKKSLNPFQIIQKKEKEITTIQTELCYDQLEILGIRSLRELSKGFVMIFQLESSTFLSGVYESFVIFSYRI